MKKTYNKKKLKEQHKKRAIFSAWRYVSRNFSPFQFGPVFLNYLDNRNDIL